MAKPWQPDGASTPPLGLEGFTNVDGSDVRAYIDYLDSVTRASRSAKSASYSAQGITLGMNVLDVGCGVGDDVRAIAELVGANGESAGVDASQALVGEARARGVPPNVVFTCASVDNLPYPDAHFDAVRAERLFQHLERADDAAAEIARVLKPNGSVLVVDQDWETVVVSGADASITRRVVQAGADALANGWAGRNHSAMLVRAGFRDVRVIAGVTTLPLGPAYALVLQSALASATASNAITSEEAETWLASLLAADQRGEFFYAVSVFAALARRA